MGYKYLVVSDNHGNLRNLERVIEVFREEIDAVIHCGDVEYPVDLIEDMAGCPVYAARGNCDYRFDRDYEALFELGGRYRALVTHGDRYSVSWGYDSLIGRAMETGADVVFFGHTHRPAYESFKLGNDRYTLMNPGSIELPRQYRPRGATFATLEVKNDGRLVPGYYLIDSKRGGSILSFDLSQYQD